MNYYLITYRGDDNLAFPDNGTEIIEADNPKQAAEKMKLNAKNWNVVDIKAIPNAETNYVVLKNHIHNTLGLSKEDIRAMVKESIDETVERRLDVFLEYNDGLQRVIDDAIRQKAYNSSFWGSKPSTLDEKIQDKIVKTITEKLTKEIGLTVSLRKKKSAK